MSKRNIIISDLLGTLISEYVDITKNGTYDDEYQEIIDFLNEYLIGDNIFMIASSDSHADPDDYINLFNVLTQALGPQKSKNLFSGIFGYKNKVEITPSTGYPVNFIGQSKDNAFEFLLNQLENREVDNLLAVGNNSDDIDLLLKVIEKGGKGFFNLTPVEKTSDDHGIIEDNYKNCSVERLAKNLAACRLSDSDLDADAWFNMADQLSQEYFDSYYRGFRTRESLEQEYEMRYIAELYHWHQVELHNAYPKRNETTEEFQKKLLLIHGREKTLPTLKKYVV